MTDRHITLPLMHVHEVTMSLCSTIFLSWVYCLNLVAVGIEALGEHEQSYSV